MANVRFRAYYGTAQNVTAVQDGDFMSVTPSRLLRWWMMMPFGKAIRQGLNKQLLPVLVLYGFLKTLMQNTHSSSLDSHHTAALLVEGSDRQCEKPMLIRTRTLPIFYLGLQRLLVPYLRQRMG